MVRKIRRFPLKMEQDIEVRSLKELKENFSLRRVTDYALNGKLIMWLRDRYENDIAEAISALDLNDVQLPKKIVEIFDIPHDENVNVFIEKYEERNRKIDILKEHNVEKKYLGKR